MRVTLPSEQHNPVFSDTTQHKKVTTNEQFNTRVTYLYNHKGCCTFMKTLHMINIHREHLALCTVTKEQLAFI